MIRRFHRRSLVSLGSAIALAMLVSSSAGAVVVHVNQAASPGGDGSSWGSAYQFLQDALYYAAEGDEIWIAQGVYHPDDGGGQTPGDSGASFVLAASSIGLSLFGGFDGTEADRADADPVRRLTVLSGDIDHNDVTDGAGVTTSFDGIAGTNSQNVVTCSSQQGSFALDGLIITGGSTSFGNGAGLLIEDCGLSLRRSRVVGNQVTDRDFFGQGGGLYFEGSSSSSLEISDSVLRSNYAGLNGGGASLNGGSGFATVTLRDVTFEDNRVITSTPRCLDQLQGGGGLTTIGAFSTLERVSFVNNQTDCVGGALQKSFSGILDISESVFVGNRALRQPASGADDASGNGGALWVGTSGSWQLRSSLLAGNTAGRDGGAIVDYIGGSLTNVTLVGNVADGVGGGLWQQRFNPDWTTRVTNAIVTGNSASARDNIYSLNAPARISHSLVEGSNGSGAGWDPLVGVDLGGNIDVDPKFLAVVPGDPLVSSYRLELGSPAIDAGDTAAVTGALDLDGKIRVFNAVVDMGAYESHLACPPGGTTQIFVDDSASGSGDGSSWGNAVPRLQDALTLAAQCAGGAIDTLWVAAGTHYADDGDYQTPGDRTAAFELQSGLAIYGGFEGTETLLSQRQPWAHTSTLSGDLGRDDTVGAHDLVESPADIVGDNSYHVVVASFTDATAVLDGFTVTGGLADGSAAAKQHEGAGLFAEGGSATLANLAFVGNLAVEGGGMTLLAASEATLTNAQFKANAAADYGGALHLEGSDPTLVNVLFTGNRAAAGGGAIYNLASSPQLVNVTVAGNAAGGSVPLAPTTVPEVAATGGGLFNFVSSKPKIRNSIIWNNLDDSGLNTPSSSIRNQDVGSTPTADNSDIAGLASITGLIFDGTSFDDDPLFIVPLDPTSAPSGAGTHRLKGSSPAIDVGDNTFNNTPADLLGATRVQNSVIDLGPFESDPAASVAVHKTADRTTAAIGDTISYAYEVINTGVGDLTNVTLIDDRLGTITLSSSTLAPGATAVGIGSYSHTVVEGDLPGPLTNVATVTSNEAPAAQDSVTISLSSRAELHLAVVVTPNGPATAGEQVVFDYTVTNTGDVTLTGLVLSDDVSGTITLSATDLAPGESATGSGSYDVQPEDPSGLRPNLATAQATAPSTAAVVSGSVAAGYLIGREADVALTVDIVPSPAVAGAPVQLVMTWENLAGPSWVVAEVSVPKFFRLNQTVWDSHTACSWSCAASGAGADCTADPPGDDLRDFATLPPGTSVTYTGTCNLRSDLEVPDIPYIAYTLEVDYDDPNGNNDGGVGVFYPIVGVADLSVTLTDDRLIALPGDDVYYSLVVRNAGPTKTTWFAEVQDLFPGELVACSWMCVPGGSASCDPGPVNGDIQDIVDLWPGDTVVYGALCTVDPAAAPYEALINTATASLLPGPPLGIVTTDPNPSNNTASHLDCGPLRLFCAGFETGDTSEWSHSVP